MSTAPTGSVARTASRLRRAPSRWWTAVATSAGGLSLRARLVAVVTGLVLLALALVSTVTLIVLHRVLLTQVDDNLRSATASGQSLGSVLDSSHPTADNEYPTDYVVQIFDADGDEARGPWAAGSSRHGRLSIDSVTPAWVRSHSEPTTVKGADGSDWRLRAVQFIVNGERATFVVALPLDGVDDSVAKLAGWMFVVGLVVVAAGALLGTGAINRAFRPLREVEQVADAFGDGDTSRRVAVAATGTEVGRLGGAVNAMLDRIETSLDAREASEARMRRFVADASHELRTPLAAVRGFAELYRIGAVRESADVTRAFERIETEATRMGGLVEDLLLLARLDEQRPLAREPVDLLLLAADAGADARAIDPERRITMQGVDGARPTPVVVVGDDSRLRQVLTNLVANALRHTPAGTPVEIGVGVRDGRALWQVVDHGHGISPDDAERVFERFWRADSSRQRGAGGGAGLGMAIVAAIVAAHSGGVDLVATPGGGATFEVSLPLAQVPHDVPQLV